MSKFRPDILIKLTCNVVDHTVKVRTNASSDGLIEILEAWILDQVGRGRDDSTPNRFDEYEVTIGFAVNGDVFGTEANTNNYALTAGLVMHALKEIEAGKAAVGPLG